MSLRNLRNAVFFLFLLVMIIDFCCKPWASGPLYRPFRVQTIESSSRTTSETTIAIIIGQTCPRGFFGSSCNLTCHCLKGDDACKNLGCIDLECDFGWNEAPACQARCPVNKYGLNCFFHCHCPFNDKCDYRNGNCQSQRCHPEWYGSGCQQRLARLFHPPTINVYDCQNVSISWKAWTYNVDIGVTNISAYILKVRHQGSQEWQDVAITASGASNFSVNVPGLKKNGIYQFRVDILSRNEKINITGPPGVPTAFVLVPCLKSDIIKSITTNTDGTINLNLAEKVNGKVSYEQTGIGDCLKTNGPIKSQHFQNVENITLKTLPWKRYLVTIQIFQPYNIKYIQSILTDETIPTGKVTNIHADRIMSDSVSLKWKKLNCSERGGVFLRYDVILTPSNGTSIIIKKNTTSETITIEELKPFTIYQVQIAFVNNHGRGNLSDKFTFKTKDSVPVPPKFIKMEAFTSALIIRWEPIKISLREILFYQVLCSQDMNFNQSISITSSALKEHKINFTNLKPFTDYYIKIQAKNSIGWGPFSSYEEIKTKEGPPLAPKQINCIYSNMTCLTLTWLHPDQINGVLTNYEITRTEIFSYVKTKQDSSQTKISVNQDPTYETCDLLPATQYEFKIRGATAGGLGLNSVPASFWTEIMPPASPPPPTIVNISYTSVTISLQPVVTYTGPVSWYEVRLKILNEPNSAGYEERQRRETESNLFENNTGYLTAVLTPQLIGYSTVFIVGDNRTYGNIRNRPLSNQNIYRIYYSVHSSLNNITKWSSSSTESPIHLLHKKHKEQASFSVIAIVIIVFILLVLLLMLTIFFYKHFWNRKSLYASQEKPIPEWMEDEVLERHWITTYNTVDLRFIIVDKDLLPAKPLSLQSDLKNFNNKPIKIVQGQQLVTKQAELGSGSEKMMKKKTPVTFRNEFDILNQMPQNKYSFKEASKIENAKRNRFLHLLPYDHCRVILNPDSSSSNTYINASRITTLAYKDTQTLSPRTYIAAQSPFNSETMRDFWRMIYQEGIQLVVMLTRHVEDKIIKCSEYLPKIVGQSFTFDEFVIRVIHIDDYVGFSVTETMLELVGGKRMNLFVFKLFDWPEKRVVGYAMPLLDMRRKVRQFSTEFPESPILVHCGTGNGRTGTFIAVDILLDEYKQCGKVSVFNNVKNLRECRPHMVRTFMQYLFIYDAIFEACQAGDLSFLTMSNLDTKFKQLTTTNRKTSRTYLEDQFALLCFLVPRLSVEEIQAGLLPENSNKHRYPDIIPPDDFRPKLNNSLFKNSTEPNLSVYINAVIVDSYKTKGGYIVTQTPLQNTVEDFWCLVYAYDIRTIVMMDINSKEDTCVSYWKHFKSFESITVISERKSVNAQSIVHQLVIRKKDAAEDKATSKVVHLFRFKCWKNPYFIPTGRDHLLDFIHDVNDWQCKDKTYRPILVHCKDGATNSGIFCACDTLIQMMTNEGCADVYQTVKKLKIRRPQMIPNLEQYKFCHSVIQLHISRHKP